MVYSPSMECTFNNGACYEYPVMLKRNQNKAAKVNSPKTGKNKRAKAMFLGFDFFAGKKCGESCKGTECSKSDSSHEDVKGEKDIMDLSQCGSEENMSTEGPLSRGSKNHANGRCRPCHYYHTPEGCPNGALCNFCHHVHSEAKLLDASAWSRRRSALCKKRGTDTMGAAPLSLQDWDCHGEFDKGATPKDQTINTHQDLLNKENKAPVNLFGKLQDHEWTTHVRPEMLLFRRMVYTSMQLTGNGVNPKTKEWIDFVTASAPEDLCNLLEASMPAYYED